MRVRLFRAAAATAGVLIVALAAPPLTPSAAAGEDAQNYVQTLIGNMVAVSKRPTLERRKFYEHLLADEIDWTGPAIEALGQRWANVAEEDRRKLADWARDSVIGTAGVMEFIQNLIFHSCGIVGHGQENGDGASIRIACSRFGSEPNFVVRLDVARNGEAYHIEDVHYVGISLRDALSDEILKPDAVQKHGVHVDGAPVN